MADYLVIKNLHIFLAILSVAIFSVRGVLILRQNEGYKHRLFRLLTPFIDTILLLLGIAMASLFGAGILELPWFIAKLVFIILYIISGILAMRLPTYKGQVTALLCAWLFVISIFYLAVYKALPFSSP